MFPHHLQSIENMTHHFEHDDEVQALLLGGSLAHGFNTAIMGFQVSGPFVLNWLNGQTPIDDL